MASPLIKWYCVYAIVLSIRLTVCIIINLYTYHWRHFFAVSQSFPFSTLYYLMRDNKEAVLYSLMRRIKDLSSVTALNLQLKALVFPQPQISCPGVWKLITFCTHLPLKPYKSRHASNSLLKLSKSRFSFVSVIRSK